MTTKLFDGRKAQTYIGLRRKVLLLLNWSVHASLNNLFINVEYFFYFLLGYTTCANTPGVDFIKLFSSSLIPRKYKLECLLRANYFRASLMFVSKTYDSSLN